MIAAHYFDGRSAKRHEVSLAIDAAGLRISGDTIQRSETLDRLVIGETMGSAPRQIRFADGAYCEVHDRAGLAALLAAADHKDSLVTTLQGRWHWALFSLAAMVLAAAALYTWALPWLAASLAPRVPASLARTVSEQALSSLDARFLRPSKLTPARQQQITADLARLGERAGPLPPYRLIFRSAPAIGPNAFALPNGDLVIFDELIDLADDDAQIVAVLAHELGHVHYRHGLRQLIQGTLVSFIAGVWFGDVSSLAAGLGALVLESSYSRSFELEADAYAAARLKAAGGDSKALITMLQRIEAKHAALQGGKRESGGKLTQLLGSHPENEERIAALRKLAAAP